MSAEELKRHLLNQIDGFRVTGKLTRFESENLQILAVHAIAAAVVEAVKAFDLCETCHKSPRAPQETECFGCLTDDQEAREERLATDRDWAMAGRLQRTGDC